MLEITMDQLTAACDFADIEAPGDGIEHGEGAFVYAGYSGRGMYGDECVGVVGTPAHAVKFLFALAIDGILNDGQDVFDIIDSMRTDSMGLDTITYWTDLKVVS